MLLCQITGICGGAGSPIFTKSTPLPCLDPVGEVITHTSAAFGPLGRLSYDIARASPRVHELFVQKFRLALRQLQRY
jgi:hypothetical protein